MSVNGNEIHIVRLYQAPVNAVWEAWVDKNQTAHWWGPRGFTLTTHSQDIRTGGHWAYTMHGPDGVDYGNKTLYHRVERLKCLEYDHGGNDDRPPLFRVKVLFSEVKGQTKMEMTMTLPTPEAAAETRQFVKKAGGDATWDRLGEYLGQKLENKTVFILNRSFQAPIKTLFELWTQPQHLSKWVAPTGFQLEFLRAEIKPGKSTFYVMTDGGRTKMYGRSQYLTIESPHRLIYIQQFCDENEKVTRHPFAPKWPETMHTTISFFEEGTKQTRVSILWEPQNPVTQEELQTFVQARGGMTQGWTGSLDKLEDFLKEIES